LAHQTDSMQELYAAARRAAAAVAGEGAFSWSPGR
jgi:hypothetical protein